MRREGLGDPPTGLRLRVVTYNVHACIGGDGRFAPGRIAAVLQELDADFIGIQELEDRRHGQEHVSRYLARELGMHACRGATLKRRDAHYGNLLLSRERPRSTLTHDISVPGREPRGIIEATYDLRGRRIRMLVTHFGLKAFERRRQVRDVLRIVESDDPDIDVLAGDFNEWRPASYTMKALARRYGGLRRQRSWPARRPLLALDRVFVAPDTVRRTVFIDNSAAARRASDHLPVVCDLHVPESPTT